jgi:ribosomal protein S3
MAQKTNQNGLRLILNKKWKSKWHIKLDKNNFPNMVYEDFILNQYLLGLFFKKKWLLSNLIIKRYNTQIILYFALLKYKERVLKYRIPIYLKRKHLLKKKRQLVRKNNRNFKATIIYLYFKKKVSKLLRKSNPNSYTFKQYYKSRYQESKNKVYVRNTSVISFKFKKLLNLKKLLNFKKSLNFKNPNKYIKQMTLKRLDDLLLHKNKMLKTLSKKHILSYLMKLKKKNNNRLIGFKLNKIINHNLKAQLRLELLLINKLCKLIKRHINPIPNTTKNFKKSNTSTLKLHNKKSNTSTLKLYNKKSNTSTLKLHNKKRFKSKYLNLQNKSKCQLFLKKINYKSKFIAYKFFYTNFGSLLQYNILKITKSKCLILLPIFLFKQHNFKNNAYYIAYFIKKLIQKRMRFNQIIYRLEDKLNINKIKNISKKNINLRSKQLSGYKIIISGKINGKFRAKNKSIIKGVLYFSKINSNLEYVSAFGLNVHGIYGIKVWLCFKD